MAIEWLLKLSGHEDDLRELRENFSFPEGLVKILNGRAKLKLSSWWEIKVATRPEHEHRRIFVER
jgi:hypothetical protein